MSGRQVERRRRHRNSRNSRPESVTRSDESKNEDESPSTTNDESKIDVDLERLELGNTSSMTTTTQHQGRSSSTLRRRRYRRGGVPRNPEDLEEGKRDDSYSPRDKPIKEEESKEGEVAATATDLIPPTNNNLAAKPPRHSLLSLSRPLTKAVNKKQQPRSSSSSSTLPIVQHNSSSYIRAKPDEKLRDKFRSRIRSPADGIPEVHFIGEVCEGVGFKDTTYVSCKWYLEWGKSWSFLAGDETSQTQYAALDDDGCQLWNHPIDVHFAAASMQGWPRIVMQVWELDEYGRSVLSGYGFTHLPTNPGYHELEIRCWRPSGSLMEELQSFFLGTSSCLVDEQVIFGKAWEKRSQLTTISSGTIKMNIHVLLRFFNEQKV